MSFHDILHVILHALKDSALILPFLFLTYLLMELLEHKAGNGVEKAIERAGKLGPLAGGALGLVPQCGFSTVAAGFYAGRVISVGTLFAVFLATSDEMLPVMLGARVGVGKILTVLGLKFGIAVLVGFFADLLLRRRKEELHVEGLCEEEGCRCGEAGVWRSTLYHTLHIFAFVLLFNLLIGFALELLGEEALGAVMRDVPVLGQLIAALVGDKKPRVFQILSEFCFYGGTVCGILGIVLNVNFGNTPTLADYDILKGMVSHSTMLFGCLYMLVGGFVKIRVFNTVSVTIGLAIFVVCGLVVNRLYEHFGMTPPDGMFLKSNPYLGVSPIILGIVAVLLLFAVLALYELRLPTEERWYTKLKARHSR